MCLGNWAIDLFACPLYVFSMRMSLLDVFLNTSGDAAANLANFTLKEQLYFR